MPSAPDDAPIRKKLFSSLFADLPASPGDRLNALLSIHHEFRHYLAQQLQPVFRSLLQESPPADEQSRKELAHQLNFVLRDTGLAILDPHKSQPSTVVAEPYRIALQSRAAHDGRRIRSGNIKNLPPLELVEHVRQEPFLTWQQRNDDKKNEKRGRGSRND